MKYCIDCKNYVLGGVTEWCIRGRREGISENPVCGPIKVVEYDFKSNPAIEQIRGDCGMDAKHFEQKLKSSEEDSRKVAKIDNMSDSILPRGQRGHMVFRFMGIEVWSMNS
jgi:hypothetical protein